MKRQKPDDLWFTDRLSPNEVHHHRLRRVLLEKKTRFQKVLLVDSFDHGRLLILDDEIQSAGRDEALYHEALVQPAMAAHRSPKSVLILGGGEGATAREVLRNNKVKEVVMVDIDGELVDFCRRHLKSWHRGSFTDPRMELVIGDAAAFVVTSSRKFDIIISDLPTPDKPGPLQNLYSVSFFRKLANSLKKGGVLVTQSGSASVADRAFHQRVERDLKKVFKHVCSHSVHVPSFGLPWGFTVASNEKISRKYPDR